VTTKLLRGDGAGGGAVALTLRGLDGAAPCRGAGAALPRPGRL